VVLALTRAEFCAIDVYEWARLVSQPTGLFALDAEARALCDFRCSY
jgi:hypothetical protein